MTLVTNMQSDVSTMMSQIYYVSIGLVSVASLTVLVGIILCCKQHMRLLKGVSKAIVMSVLFWCDVGLAIAIGVLYLIQSKNIHSEESQLAVYTENECFNQAPINSALLGMQNHTSAATTAYALPC